jgi:putative ABC transport system permease protein
MNILESLRVSLRGLTSNKMRSFLTMLGIIIGVAVVILVVAIGQGAALNVKQNIEAFGNNLLMIWSGSSRIKINAITVKTATGSGSAAAAGNTNTLSTTSGASLYQTNTLTLADAQDIAKDFPQTVLAVAPEVRGNVQIRLGSNNSTTSIIGSTPDYALVSNAPVDRGRYFTNQEVDGRLKVCVIGATVAYKLAGDSEANLVGRTIYVNQQNFLVVGMLKPKGTGMFGQDQDDVIVAPITTVMDRVLNRRFLSNINVECVSQKMMPLAQQQISNFLRVRHHLLPPFPENDDFNIRSQTEILQRMNSITGTMTSMLSLVAIISLLVGGIGIMNIMLVSVTERTREIGIRKAIGATPSDIMWQFLIESSLISLMGGIIGIIGGVGGAYALSKIGGWVTIINPTAIVVAIVVSAGVGIFFGIYPAHKASSLPPIEALRYE